MDEGMKRIATQVCTGRTTYTGSGPTDKKILLLLLLPLLHLRDAAGSNMNCQACTT